MVRVRLWIVILWNLQEQEIKPLTGHDDCVYSVAFSPVGKTSASASGDNTVKLWNLQGQEIKTLRGHDSGVYSVAFSPVRKAFSKGVGNTIASASKDMTVKLWNFDLDDLLVRGCDWLRDYLKYNAPEEDKDLCDGIGSGK